MEKKQSEGEPEIVDVAQGHTLAVIAVLKELEGSRGRNESFSATSLQVECKRADLTCVVSAYSRRVGAQAPAILRLSYEDALTLAQTIFDTIGASMKDARI